jgi:hypothetical protein
MKNVFPGKSEKKPSGEKIISFSGKYFFLKITLRGQFSQQDFAPRE